MKFCPDCGQPVELRIPAGDNLPRAVCTRLRRHALREPARRGRLRARMARAAFCCAGAPSSRAAATGPRRRAFWRSASRCSGRGRARPPKRRWPRSTIGSLLSDHQRAARRPGARDVSRAACSTAEFGARRREPGDRRCSPKREIPWDEIAFPSIAFRAGALFRGSARRPRTHAFSRYRAARRAEARALQAACLHWPVRLWQNRTRSRPPVRSPR